MRAHRYVISSLSLIAASALAQTPTGTIAGTVTDPAGNAIPGAAVTISEISTNETKQLTTDSQGRYSVPFINPGNYIVKVIASGFTPASQTGIHVSVSETNSADFKMKVGQTSDTVDVSANEQHLDTETSNLSTTIQTRQILDLPDNGRNPFDFASLAPTVSNVGGASTPHIGGSRNGNNEQLIDGMTNILPENNVGNNLSAYTPIIDSVQEVNVQSSVLEAQYGRFSGGIISLVTKGGSNQFHGSVFEFAEPSVLNAQAFGTRGSTKPDGHRYQTGGTFGGPIFKDKTFFFGDFEDSRQAVAGSSGLNVPNPAYLKGDFSSYGKPIYDPYSVHPDGNGGYIRTAFPGNQIPTQLLNTPASKIAQKVLSYYPTTSGTGDITAVSVAGTSTNNYYHFDTRLDQQFGQKWHSFIRFSHFAGTSIPLSDFGNAATTGGYNGPDKSTAYSLSFNNVVTFTPTLIGEFRYGLSKSTSVRTAFGQGFDATTLGLPASTNTQADQNVRLFPHFGFGQGYSDIGAQGYIPLQENPLAQDVNASLDKIIGGHTIKVGGEFRLLNLDFYQYTYPSGNYYSDQSWTRKDPNNGNDGSGNAIASFLLGLPSGGNITVDPHTNQTSYYLAGYLQDDWKATKNLTLNYGLRYDIELPRTESHNQLSYWDPTLTSALASVVPATGVSCPNCGSLRGQMVLAGSSNSKYGRQQTNTQKKDFAPRFGFAFSASSKLAIRGGYGLVFQPSALQAAGSSGAAGVEGFNAQTNFNPSFDNQHTAPVADLSNPYPDGYQIAPALDATCLATPSCIANINIGNQIQTSFFSNSRTPYTQQWNLSVQYQLPKNFIVEAAYLGSKGTFLINGDPAQPFDQLPAADLALGNSLTQQVANPFYGKITTIGSPLARPTIQRNQLLRQYPQYNGVSSFRKPGASSIYHAFTLRVEHQFTRGFSYTFAFTGSKAEDNAAGSVGYLGPTSQTYADQYHPEREFGLSAYDVSRILTSSAIYELPFGHNKRFGASLPKAVDLFVGGWQVNGIVTYSSGTPLIIGGYDNGSTSSAIFTSGQRPDATGMDYKTAHPTKAQFFNTAALAKTAPFTIGNAPRVMPDVRNPSYNNFDSSLVKNTRFGPSERYNFQLRFEMFNTLNHQIAGGPGTSINNTYDFGIIRTNQTTGQLANYQNGARQVQVAGKFTF
jgi:hypothetical protein